MVIRRPEKWRGWSVAQTADGWVASLRSRRLTADSRDELLRSIATIEGVDLEPASPEPRKQPWRFDREKHLLQTFAGVKVAYDPVLKTSFELAGPFGEEVTPQRWIELVDSRREEQRRKAKRRIG